MHPTGGSLRVFMPFVWLEVGSGKEALSRPTHQRVTQAVSPLHSLSRQPGVLSWKIIACHHSKVHPTGGSLRAFGQFAWLGVGSGKMALSRPTHQRVTQAVSPPSFMTIGEDDNVSNK